jgi:hypothetical protein
MSTGPLSPVMIIATDGFLQDQGLAINGNLTIAINNYNATTVVSDYTDVLIDAALVIGNANNEITQSTFSTLQNLAANILPAVTNAVPSAYLAALGPLGNTYTGGFSGIVTAQANRILGSGDLSIFSQVYNIAQSYVTQTNQYINSVVNSNVLDSTFVNMDALTTGSVSEVNDDLSAFGADLVKLGQTWDLSNLAYFGSPAALLYQLIRVGGLLPEVAKTLTDAGLSSADLIALRNNGVPVLANIDLLIYRAMLTVTGDLLDQVKLLLDVTTSGLVTMADLLNPVKTLPNSYTTLTVNFPTGNSSAAVFPYVYLESGGVNSNLELLFVDDVEYQELILVIPPDQALANKAIARSLQQIKNIFNLTLPEFATSVVALETNTGLSAINALTQPVPSSIQTSFLSMLATGTGPNGTLTLFDFVGVVAGVPYTDEFNQATATLTQLQSGGQLDTLTDSVDGVYTIMINTLNGDYTTVIDPGPPIDLTITIPGGLPGAGTYLSLDSAFTTGLIPAAQSLIGNIVTANPSSAAVLNSNFNDMAEQLTYETTNLTKAGVDFTELTGNATTSLLSLGTSLHDIGLDEGDDGQNALFTAIADTTNIYGQAVIASLREGRNIAALNAVGINTDTQIPLEL